MERTSKATSAKTRKGSGVDMEDEKIRLKEFASQVNDVVDKMKAAFKAAEKASASMDQWAKGRRTYEDQNDVCNCVSDVMEDMTEILGVSMHVLHTYGHMLVSAADRVVKHQEENVAEIKQRIEETLDKLPDEIRNHLTGLEDKAKLN